MDLDEPIDFDFAEGESLWGSSSADYRATALTWSTTSRSAPYSLGFATAVDALVKVAVEDHHQDSLLFPILFTARHAIELHLKEIIYGWSRINREPVEILRTHKLQVLWPLVRDIMVKMWPDGDQTHLDRLGKVIEELAEVDPDSFTFRYDTDLQGYVRDIPEQLRRVDLVHVQRLVAKVILTLSSTLDAIGDWEDSLDY